MMIVDTRRALSTETVERIRRACEAAVYSDDPDGRPNRNAVRRYRRLIRRVSGYCYVTCHHVEHTGEFAPASRTVAFGRAE